MLNLNKILIYKQNLGLVEVRNIAASWGLMAIHKARVTEILDELCAFMIKFKIVHNRFDLFQYRIIFSQAIIIN